MRGILFQWFKRVNVRRVVFNRNVNVPCLSSRWQRFNPRRGNVHQVLLCSAGFSLGTYLLTDEDIKRECQIIEMQDAQHKSSDGWEPLVEEGDLRVYRRRIPGKYELYEYKCSGTYYDISAKNFVDAQAHCKKKGGGNIWTVNSIFSRKYKYNVEYRRKWDSNVQNLEVVEDFPESDTQIIRWVAKFPYPMYPRLYIYARRRLFDEENHKVAMCSYALSENDYPDDSGLVRVTVYRSSMIVQAHKSYEENGLDYVLTYCDDPNASIPKVAYNWIVNRGGPYFLQQVHKAAKAL